MTVQQHPEDRFVSVGGGMRLCYRTHGDPAHPTVLLVHGLGMQLIAWPELIVDGLVERGFHVVRFDNRDIGRSSQGRAPAPRTFSLATRRGWHPSQYSLDDMAADTAGLVDALELGPVHAVGVSMGGMIAQTLTARYPQHVASLTSVMSMTGAPRSGRPAPSTWLRMASPPAKTREAAVQSFTSLTRHIGSRGFAVDASAIAELAGAQWDRGHARPHEGVTRQLAAIMKSGDRSGALRGITAPTLVIHGDRDPMVHTSGGRATAATIPGARLEIIAGMGHDLPEGACPKVLDLIASHAQAVTPVVV
jgi:pimeloyl-ACP methyl ester carboxylesterase